jgi:hypothetical protein
MLYLNVSVRGFNSQFTRHAKKHDLTVNQLMQVPVCSLTTVRLTGPRDGLETFLTELGFEPTIVKMHLAAAKSADGVAPPPALKNIKLREHREA